MRLLERDIQKQCIDFLRLDRWFVLNFSRHDCPDIAGISDILALREGRYIWIEFKRSGNCQQSKQVEFERAIKDHGGEYVVVRSLDELVKYLRTGEIASGPLHMRSRRQ